MGEDSTNEAIVVVSVSVLCTLSGVHKEPNRNQGLFKQTLAVQMLHVCIMICFSFNHFALMLACALIIIFW